VQALVVVRSFWLRQEVWRRVGCFLRWGLVWLLLGALQACWL